MFSTGSVVKAENPNLLLGTVLVIFSQWPIQNGGGIYRPDVEVRKQYQERNMEECAFLYTIKEDRSDPTTCSSWVKLTRVTATVNRFAENCRSPMTLRKTGDLTLEEIVSLEMHIIQVAQQDEFQEEMRRALKSGRELPGKTKLLHLRPILNKLTVDGPINLEFRTFRKNRLI